jgi:hypothetical protein
MICARSSAVIAVASLLALCVYAHLVAAGDVPGPDRDGEARAYARARFSSPTSCSIASILTS